MSVPEHQLRDSVRPNTNIRHSVSAGCAERALPKHLSLLLHGGPEEQHEHVPGELAAVWFWSDWTRGWWHDGLRIHSPALRALLWGQWNQLECATGLLPVSSDHAIPLLGL